MKKCSEIGFVVILMVLFGCSSYRIDRDSVNKFGTKVDTSGNAYVAVSEDGRYDSTIYHGSGTFTSRILMDEFSEYLPEVVKGDSPETYNEAMKSALYGGYRYLVYPSIEQWEDHLTEVTGIQDKVKIKIIVADTLSGNILDSITINCKSKPITPGGEEPQDLLAPPIQIFVNSLFK